MAHKWLFYGTSSGIDNVQMSMQRSSAPGHCHRTSRHLFLQARYPPSSNRGCLNWNCIVTLSQLETHLSYSPSLQAALECYFNHALWITPGLARAKEKSIIAVTCLPWLKNMVGVFEMNHSWAGSWLAHPWFRCAVKKYDRGREKAEENYREDRKGGRVLRGMTVLFCLRLMLNQFPAVESPLTRPIAVPFNLPLCSFIPAGRRTEPT